MRRLTALAICTILVGSPAVVSSPLPPSGELAQHNAIRSGAAVNLGWSSPNWSGYAVTNGPYASVSGTWNVPAVNRSPKATYSSSWVGVDGFSNSSLIQTGTEQDYYLGAAHYSAWWEIPPAAAVVIDSLPVHPGDTMSATITKSPGSRIWTITLTNTTTGRTFSTVQRYGGPGGSAEWIQEAPTVGDTIAALAAFSPVTFHGTVNGRSPRLRVSNGGALIQNGLRVSTPSAPESNAGGFTVHRRGPTPAVR